MKKTLRISTLITIDLVLVSMTSNISELVETLLGFRIFIFALRMVKDSRKRKTNRLGNLASTRLKNRNHTSNKVTCTDVDNSISKWSRKEIPAKKTHKSPKNDQIEVTKHVKKFPFRYVVHIEPYFETPKPRGHNNGEYKATSGTCVLAAQSEGEKNSNVNWKMRKIC